MLAKNTSIVICNGVNFVYIFQNSTLRSANAQFYERPLTCLHLLTNTYIYVKHKQLLNTAEHEQEHRIESTNTRTNTRIRTQTHTHTRTCTHMYTRVHKSLVFRSERCECMRKINGCGNLSGNLICEHICEHICGTISWNLVRTSSQCLRSSK